MAQEIADSKLLDTWGSSGTKIEPDISKIIEGWQLGEQPPHEYMNWLQNTFGSKLNHILKNGIAKWYCKTEYLAGASVQHSGSIWLCETTNTNSEPTDLNANWEKVAINKDLTVTVDTLADLRSISYPANTVWASGYHTKNDGAFGSHIFRLKGVKTIETDNGGTVIIATIGGTDYVYELQYDGAVNVKWFGAKGDGVSDDTEILSTLLNDNEAIVGTGSEIFKFSAMSLTNCNISDIELSTTNVVSNILSITSADSISIDNAKITKTAVSTADNGHIIVLPGQDNAYINNLDISTVSGTGTGLLFYSLDGIDKISDVTLENINVTGDVLKSLNTNGVLITDGSRCILDKIRAYGIHDYAVEYKNKTRHSLMSNIIVEYSKQGIGFGQTTVGADDVSFTAVNNVVTKDCDIGIVLGDANNNSFSNININRTISPEIDATIPKGVRYVGVSTTNLCANINISGDITEPIRYGATCTNNYTSAAIHTTGNTVIIEEGADRNITEILHPSARDRIIGTESSVTGTNPMFCHGTGEYNGIIGDYWHWKKSDAGAVAPLSGTKWVYESAGTSYIGMIGDDASSLGLSIRTPTRTASLTYASSDYWQTLVNGGGGTRLYSTVFRPTSDNLIALGVAANRWSVVYAGTGTINTSDERLKTFLEIEEAESQCAKALKTMIRKYKFNDAIESKGELARIHYGVSAQSVIAKMEEFGLDAMKYGFICYDEWEEQQEVKDEEGNIIEPYRPAGDRYGIRYEELLCFIISAI